MDTSDQLELIRLSTTMLLSEMAISLGVILVLVIGLITKRSNLTYWISLFVSFINLILLIAEPADNNITLFGGMLVQDSTNYTLRILLAAIGLLIVLIATPQTIDKHRSEFYVLLLTVILGAQLLVMSSHMAMMLISLELMSISSYVLAGYSFNKHAAEAGVKYFIYGATATAFLIFGFSWFYGLGEGLALFNPAFVNKLSYNNHIVLMAAGLMVVAGLLFKMAATPFHFWAPDVYQAAPWPVLALFSTVPKVAAGAFLLKLVGVITLQGESRYDWQTTLAVLAILTLTVGNFSALWQKNIKRLMAYSSIGQAGFLLCIVATFNTSASNIFLFYGVVLSISTLLVFLLLQYYENNYQVTTLADFVGLGRTNPLPATLLTVGLISLTGLPITAGFTAKLMVFSGVLSAYQETHKPALMLLFGFGLLNTVVSLYYYLQIPYYAFLKDAALQSGKPKYAFIVLAALLAIGLIVLFFLPNLLLN
jgi:NADH-quinone oxidoreductase subunit N